MCIGYTFSHFANKQNHQGFLLAGQLATAFEIVTNLFFTVSMCIKCFIAEFYFNSFYASLKIELHKFLNKD